MFENKSLHSLDQTGSSNTTTDDISNSNPQLISPNPITAIPLTVSTLDSSSTSTYLPRKILDDSLSPSPTPRIRSRSASFSKQKTNGYGLNDSPQTNLQDPSNHPNHISQSIDSSSNSILALRNIAPQNHVSSRLPQTSQSFSNSSSFSSDNKYTNWAIDKLICLFEYFLNTDSEDENDENETDEDEGDDDNQDKDTDKDGHYQTHKRAQSSRKYKRRDSLSKLRINSKQTASHLYTKSSWVVISFILLLTVSFISTCAFSFITTTPDTKICRLPYMNESYKTFPEFNQSSTHLGSKYSLLLYREQNIESIDDLNGVPVIFIPGNAGSYRQVRSLAAEAAHQFDSTKNNDYHEDNDKKGLDFFTTDFGEDLTAFHGKTLIEQAEYLNDAIKFILSLYENHHQNRKFKKGSSNHLPYPKSVILIGHSMGGMVARAMFTLSNYEPGSINTILTFAAPHSLPPVSSDPDLVRVYESVNRYWRDSFSQDLIGQNSLSHVSVISIAGGSLDQMIPSDHASVSSMVPPTNGITVFTSTIPFVWSGIDHQAIIWCDQLRKVVARSLLDIVDARFSTKTKPIYDRMQIFSRHFLTGLENDSQGYLPPTISDLTDTKDDNPDDELDNDELNCKSTSGGLKSSPDCIGPDTLLLFNDISRVYIPNNEKLRLDIGTTRSSPVVYLLPIPSEESGGNGGHFSLLTDQKLISPTKYSTVPDVDQLIQQYHDSDVESGVYTLACRYPVDHKDIIGSLLSTLDVSKKTRRGNPTTFVCTNMASLAKYVPTADREYSAHALAPPDPADYSSFIYYNVSDLSTYDFITIVDTNDISSQGYLVADIDTKSEVFIDVEDHNSLFHFALRGETVKLSSDRPIMVDVSFKTVWSSLLAYRLTIKGDDSTPNTFDESDIYQYSGYFYPFLRQYVDDPHESKFYLNLLPDTRINVNVHAIAPFSPFNHKSLSDSHVTNYHNLHFQIWSDNKNDIELFLELDLIASLGKLVLHYRVALAYFPVCIIALVFLLQLHIYNTSGFFVSFGDGIRIFTAKCLLWLLILVAFLPIIITTPLVDKLFYLIEPSMDPSTGEGPASAFFLARKNQFFLGLERGHLWVLGPLFILVAVGICHATYCIVLFIVNFLGGMMRVVMGFEDSDDSRWLYKIFNRISLVALLICTGMFVPYQLSYVLLCFLQLFSAINQQSHLKKFIDYEKSQFPNDSLNLLHLTMSILILMVWIAPTNLTTLAVYIHNLRLEWDMPFHSFENLVSIAPIILLCERINSSRMVPKMTRSKTQRLLTYCMMIYIAGYSLIFGMQRMYWIYHLVNFLAGWMWAAYAEVTDDNNEY